MKTFHLTLVASLAACCLTASATHAADTFQSAWDKSPDRVWVGPAFWANPMEDFRVADGRLECTSGGNDRNVHVLTRQLSADAGTARMSLGVGVLQPGQRPGNVGWLLGVQDEIDDYRARLLRGRGVFVGVGSNGLVRVGSQRTEVAELAGAAEMELQVTIEQGDGPTRIALTVVKPATDAQDAQSFGPYEATLRGSLAGNLAIIQNHDVPAGRGAGPRYWFRDWKMSGDKLVANDEQTFGPILWAMHSLSRTFTDDGYVMKMTAQMPPLGAADVQTVELHVPDGDGWKQLQSEPIDPLARTATFRVTNWDASRDTRYRLAYTLRNADGGETVDYYEGTVRRDPVERNVKVAGFTGNQDTGFPNLEVARNVAIHDPDVLFFSGDQIYENVGGFGIIREPVEPAVLNYLRKWYLLGFAFRDLMRDRVTICLPDDHDVYQGNIWGNGGNSVPSIAEHERGGYAMHRDFVNAVHRTQTAHHPDPYDPTPIKQNISVFYGELLYGRVSFAVIADRMFKSGPTNVATWPGRPDHMKDPNYDVAKLDKPGLNLLGERQLEFLDAWARDWRGADFKCVLSQTIFCNLANYHGGDKEFIYADLDSNGWPQTGRRKAVDAMRRGFAFHYAGDQHLPSIVLHGIDEFGDAGYSFCVPSIAAGYPRSWLPDMEGRPVVNRPPDGLPNTGEYLDAFGNKMTVYAIGNPEPENRPGRINTLHDKSSGYGLVTFDKDDGTIKIECFRLQIDAANLKPGDQFPGWPMTINQLENYGRTARAWLPTIRVTGVDHPVFQVVDEATGEIVYTVRVRQPEFQPKVFAPGRYTVRVGDPDQDKLRELRGLAARDANDEVVEVEF